jgi:hypothetical protein
MKYEIVFEFERGEQYPLSEIIKKVDYSISNPEKLLEKAFEDTQKEKLNRYITEVKLIFDEFNIFYDIKVVKILPKYLKGGVDKINFKTIFQVKFEKEIKNKSFIKKVQNEEFMLFREEIPGLEKLIEKTNPSKIFIKKS